MKRPNNNYINDELQGTIRNLALYIKLGIVPGYEWQCRKQNLSKQCVLYCSVKLNSHLTIFVIEDYLHWSNNENSVKKYCWA